MQTKSVSPKKVTFVKSSKVVLLPPPSIKKEKKNKIDKVNTIVVEETALQKVISHRELKYKYPAGLEDTLKRKAYRQKLRNELRSLQLSLVGLKGQEKKEKESLVENWKVEHMY